MIPTANKYHRRNMRTLQDGTLELLKSKNAILLNIAEDNVSHTMESECVPIRNNTIINIKRKKAWISEGVLEATG